ncbi:MAG: hypothetical protein Kow0047_10920 [Anaerolineae bacterium]
MRWPALAAIAALLASCALPIITPVPTATPSPSPTPTPTPIIYEVQPGDTLWGIAQRFGLPVEILALANELDDPNLIRPGQRLLISDKVTISGRPLPTPTPTPVPCQDGCLSPPPGCEIKGIVARLDGTKFYLLPGDPLYGRRAADIWFCREIDAQQAGWQRWVGSSESPRGP